MLEEYGDGLIWIDMDIDMDRRTGTGAYSNATITHRNSTPRMNVGEGTATGAGGTWMDWMDRIGLNWIGWIRRRARGAVDGGAVRSEIQFERR